jgi:hypothetical protein
MGQTFPEMFGLLIEGKHTKVADARGSAVITPLVWVYLGGWMLTTTTALMAARTMADSRRPPSLRGYLVTSLVAGAIWPLLLVGVVELGALAGAKFPRI